MIPPLAFPALWRRRALCLWWIAGIQALVFTLSAPALAGSSAAPVASASAPEVAKLDRATLLAATKRGSQPPSTLELLEISGPPPGTPRALLLEVHINEQAAHETDMFLSLDPDPNKNLYARGEDLKRWRLTPPDVAPHEYAGDKFYPLKAIPGLTYHVDTASLTVQITAPAAAFSGTTIGGLHPRSPAPQKTPLGGFLNYDFLGNYAGDQTQVNGLFQAGLFNNWGVGTGSFLYRDIGRSGSNLVRLDTAWRHDNPGNMTTLIFGDAITRGGTTGLAVRMGGIQFGTNFATQPYLTTFPVPNLGGETALPSTIDLYVNGMLKKTQQVPPGPFSVPFVPVQTGPGQIQLVVHDALGRERIITASFYASSQLLKPGLNDYSISLGKLRENYGYASNDYGSFVASGLFRHGFTEHFTGEIHADASEGLQDISMGGYFATTGTGVVNAGFALSHSRLGSGALAQFGWQQQWPYFNLGARAQFASPDFTELGYNGLPAPRRQLSANVGATLGAGGSISLAYVDQDNPVYGNVRLISANYGVNTGHLGYLNVGYFHTLAGTSNNGLSLTFTLSFGRRSSASFGATRQNGELHGFAQVQQSLPIGTGIGYRASTEFGPNPVNQAEFAYRNSVGTWRIGAQNAGGNTIYQAEASGGLAFLGGGVFPTRQIDGAFGVVEVPGLAGVTVYADNQPVAVTDSDGYALIPSLRAYQYNPISLSAENLPLSAQVTTVKLQAVPRYRSAAFVKFPITTTRGATLTILLENGKPLPAGATVQIKGQAQKFPVGLRGEAYLTGLADHNVLTAIWDRQHCEIKVDMPKSDDPLPDLGTYTCKGIHP